MESAVHMQLRSKALPPPPPLPPAESIRRERQCSQQRQSAAGRSGYQGATLGRRADRARGLCKEKPPFCLTPRQESLTFWGLWSSPCSISDTHPDNRCRARNEVICQEPKKTTTLKPNRQFLWGVCEVVECDGLRNILRNKYKLKTETLPHLP